MIKWSITNRELKEFTMEKVKKIKLNNQVKWMILVGVILFILAILSIGRIIDYTKATSAI